MHADLTTQIGDERLFLFSGGGGCCSQHVTCRDSTPNTVHAAQQTKMIHWNRILAGVFALGCLSVGEGFDCYTCPFGACFLHAPVSCSFGQLCGTSTAAVSTILGDATLKGKGCIGIFQCLSKETRSYLGMDYSVSNSCCFGNLCNSSTSARPSLLTGLITLLAMLLMKCL